MSRHGEKYIDEILINVKDTVLNPKNHLSAPYLNENILPWGCYEEETKGMYRSCETIMSVTLWKKYWWNSDKCQGQF